MSRGWGAPAPSAPYREAPPSRRGKVAHPDQPPIRPVSSVSSGSGAHRFPLLRPERPLRLNRSLRVRLAKPPRLFAIVASELLRACLASGAYETPQASYIRCFASILSSLRQFPPEHDDFLQRVGMVLPPGASTRPQGRALRCSSRATSCSLISSFNNALCNLSRTPRRFPGPGERRRHRLPVQPSGRR
jgi:hypothetical protein